jgi:hypothetical protein
MEPISELIYPIVNNIDQVVVAGAEGYDPEEQESAVGVIISLVYWRSIIRDILPFGSNGIQVVFTSCSKTFTYEVNGV